MTAFIWFIIAMESLGFFINLGLAIYLHKITLEKSVTIIAMGAIALWGLTLVV